MRRLTTAVWSGFWLSMILIGPPWALIALFGWPIPRHLPDEAHLHELITVSGVLTLWLLWAVTVGVIIAETVRAIRRIRLPGLRMAAPPEGFLTGLISAMVVAITSIASRGAMPAAAPTPAAATAAPQPPSPAAAAAAADASPHQTADAADTTTATPMADTQADSGTATVVVAGQRYTYTVRRGDTLSHIAAAWLGDPDRWPEIYHLNQGRHFPTVGGILHNPNLIYPGWVLNLPADARPPAGTPPTPAQHPDGTPPAPATPAPATPAPARPPAAGDHHHPDGGPRGTPTATATPPTQPSAGTPAAAPPPPPAADRDHPGGHGSGVDLPGGGWVAAPLAGAVAAAAALAWIHRRRRYRPHPPTGSIRADPDLTPLPDTIAALQAAAPPPTREDTMDDRAPDAAEAATVTPTALGSHAQQTLQLADLPPAGLGLTGPGAPNAARGLLAAVLSSGGPWAAEHEATLLTTTADLNTLLETTHSPTRLGLDRLHSAATLTDALNDLERHLLHRARLAAEHDTADLTTTAPPDPDSLPLPPIVLLTTAPAGGAATRLVAILTVGARLAITGVLLGAWPPGATWQVNTDGTTHPHQRPDTTGPRLNMLTAPRPPTSSTPSPRHTPPARTPHPTPPPPRRHPRRGCQRRRPPAQTPHRPRPSPAHGSEHRRRPPTRPPPTPRRCT